MKPTKKYRRTLILGAVIVLQILGIWIITILVDRNSPSNHKLFREHTINLSRSFSDSLLGGGQATPGNCTGNPDSYSKGIDTTARSLRFEAISLIKLSVLFRSYSPQPDARIVVSLVNASNTKSYFWDALWIESNFPAGQPIQAGKDFHVLIPAIPADARLTSYLWNIKGTPICLDQLDLEIQGIQRLATIEPE
ncbi:MAG: hypothetical protein KKA07_09535 [Bacteroidetes bacterium]|nr:hypothetical protein [Bacteroidota bacterium]MBU1719302.1 hypothetical protein [Bacteroidota bacterium]